MISRSETIVCWCALPLGLSVAWVTNYVAEHVFGEDPIYSIFYGFLAFMATEIGIALWLTVQDPGKEEHRTRPCPGRSRLRAARRPEGKCIKIRLTREGANALHHLMALLDAQEPESTLINCMLIRYQRALRKRVLGDWQDIHDI